MEENRSYFAVLPANVRYDSRLKLLSRILYAEITALCNEKGFCWARNKYFADLYGVSTKTISTCISQLKECGYVDIEMIYKEGSKEIVNRYLRICNEGIEKIFHTPMEENVKENNININNTSNKKTTVVKISILSLPFGSRYSNINTIFMQTKKRNNLWSSLFYIKSFFIYIFFVFLIISYCL